MSLNPTILILLLMGCVALLRPGFISAQDMMDKSQVFLKLQLKNQFILSLKIPDCDPLSQTNLKNRSFTYDTALAIVFYKMQGNHEMSNRLIAGIKPYISNNGVDFSYDADNGALGIRYIRSGAVAWLGYALVYADELELAGQLAEFLLGRRIDNKNDLRYGLFRGGFGEVRQNEFIDTEIQWTATEHNIDVYFFLRDFGLKLKPINQEQSEKYLKIAHDLKAVIVEQLWDKTENRFLRGISESGQDREKVLDAQTWGALFLYAIGNKDLAIKALDFARANFKASNKKILTLLDDPSRLNCMYNCPDLSISGFKPYLESEEYKNSPNIVWTEGTLGYILAAHRLKVPTINEWQGMQSLSRCSVSGGLLQATETRNQIPYEIHTWESAASTLWSLFVITDKTLPETKRLWASDQSLHWTE